MRTVEALDDGGRRRGFGNRQRLAGARRRHEAEHRQVGIGIDEHVANESVRAEALQVVELTRQCRGGAAFGVGETERLDALRHRARPRAGRIHEMSLHVENELVAGERLGRRRRLHRRSARNREMTPGQAGRRIGPVHRQQGGRRTGQSDQEAAPVLAQPASVRGRLLQRIAPCQLVHRFQRHRNEFTVAGAVELDRQAQAIGIDTAHGGTLVAGTADTLA